MPEIVDTENGGKAINVSAEEVRRFQEKFGHLTPEELKKAIAEAIDYAASHAGPEERSSWKGEVDTASGAVTQQEIDNANKW